MPQKLACARCSSLVAVRPSPARRPPVARPSPAVRPSIARRPSVARPSPAVRSSSVASRPSVALRIRCPC